MDKDNKPASTVLLEFDTPEDKTKNLIKVIGVGGGGCNAVKNMYEEGIDNVSFAVCNTDSQSLSKSPVPVKIQLGDRGLGVGGKPEKGCQEAEKNIDDLKRLLSDGSQMVFVTAGMGGGTGTGAGPVVAKVAKELGLLTIGVVTIPFYFEKRPQIIKALKGVEEMRKNVDSLLIVNNERLCDVYSDTHITVKEAFKNADNILCNAVKSISELITIEGNINVDFCDVESTMKGSHGGAIMAIGKARGEMRVQKAFLNALNSPLLYGNDIGKAKRILFNIYTSEDYPLYVDEMEEIDAFMDELPADIDVIWGVSEDNTLGEDAKLALLATGLPNDMPCSPEVAPQEKKNDRDIYNDLIDKLYSCKSKSKESKASNGSSVSSSEPAIQSADMDSHNPCETTDNKNSSITVQGAGNTIKPDDNNSTGNGSSSGTNGQTEGRPNDDTITDTGSNDATTYNASKTHSIPVSGPLPLRPLTFLERMKKRLGKVAETLLTEEEE